MTMRDCDIHAAIEAGELSIDPYDPDSVGPASIDLTLSVYFMRVDGQGTGGVIRMDQPIEYEKFTRQRVIIPPKSFILASTIERVTLPADICAKVEGRSSIGRMGLFVQNAGWVDPGWDGCLTLELYNANEFPIEIVAGRRICQLVLDRMTGPVDKPYAGKYKGDGSVAGSRIYKDWEALLDDCEICNGELGGVKGNENVIHGKKVCDYCYAKMMRGEILYPEG